MPEVVGTAIVEIIPDTSAFTAAMAGLGPATAAGMAGAEAGIAGSLGAMSASLSKAGAAATGVGRSLTGMTVAAGAFAILGGKAAYDFDTSMRRVGAITSATSEQFDAMDSLAQKLGRDTAFTASQAADGMSKLALAGFSVNEILAAMPGVINLAATANADLEFATNVAAVTLRAYKFEAEEVGRVNDVLAMTMTKSNTDIQKLAEGLKYVIPLAKNSGLSFEEVSAALGVMSDAGFQGSLGGTALRQAISKLEKPTKQGEQVMERLGLSFHNADGSLKPLIEVVKDFERVGLSTADAITLFGVRAGPGFVGLVSQGSAALQKLTEENMHAGKEIQIVGENLKFTEQQLGTMKDAFDFTFNSVSKFGYNVDETSAILGLLVKKGQDAGQASMTLMKAMEATRSDGILPLVGATRDLDGNLLNSEGEVMSLSEILARLQSGGYTTTEALAALGDGSASLAELASLSSDEMSKLSTSMANGGRAAEIAKEQLEGIKGGLKRLKSSVEGVAIVAFGGKDGLINKLGDVADAIALWLNKLMELNPGLVKFTVGVVMALGALGLFMRVIGSFLKSLSGLAKIGQFFVANPIYLALAAFVIVAVLAYQKSEAFREAISNLWDAVKGLYDAIVNLFSPAVDESGNSLEESGDKASVFESVLKTVGDALAIVTDGLTLIVDWLTKFVDWAGKSEVAAEALKGVIIGLGVAIAIALLPVDWPALLIGALVAVGVAAYGLINNVDGVRKAVEKLVDKIQLLWRWIWNQLKPSLEKLVDPLQRIGDAISNFSFDDFQGSLGELAAALGGFIDTLFQETGRLIEVGKTAMGHVFDGMVEAVKDIPVIGSIVSTIIESFRMEFNASAGLSEAIAGVFTLDPNMILEGLGGVASAILTFLLVDLPTGLIGSIADIGAALEPVISGALTWLGDNLGTVVTGLAELPGKLYDAITGAFEDDPGTNAAVAGNTTDNPTIGLMDRMFASLGDWIKNNAERKWKEAFDKLFEVNWAKVIGGGLLIGMGAVLAYMYGLPVLVLSLIGGAVAGAVSSIINGLNNIVDTQFGELKMGEGMGPRVVEWFMSGMETLGGLLLDGIKGFFDDLGLGGAVEWLLNALDTVIGGIFKGLSWFIDQLSKGIAGFSEDMNNVVSGIPGAFRWLWDNLWAGVTGFASDIAGLGTAIWDGLNAAATAIGDAVSTFMEDVGNAFDELVTDFGLDPEFFSQATEGIRGIGTAVSTALGWVGEQAMSGLTWLGNSLSELPGMLYDWASTAGQAVIDGLLAGLRWITAQGNYLIDLFLEYVWHPFLSFLGIESPSTVAAGVGQNIMEGLLNGLTTGVTAVWNFMSTIPSTLMTALGNLGDLLLGWITTAWNWVAINGPIILTNVGLWIISIPGQILGWLGDLGSLLLGWFTTAWNWVVTNGPIILTNVLTWVTSIPSLMIGSLGDLGGRLFDWLRGAFDTVVTRGPELISGLIGFFAELPGKIFGAISGALSGVGGFVVDAGGAIWEAVKGYINRNFIRPLQGKSFNLGPVSITPFSGLPELAEGGIIRVPTPALVGEAGPEVIIPLTDAARAKELVMQSGLMGLIAGQPTAPMAAALPTADAGAMPGLALAPPPTGVDAGPISDSTTTAMTAVAGSALTALQPVSDWFTQVGPLAASTMTLFGETVWTAAQPGLQFFYDQFMALFGLINTFLTTWPMLAATILLPLGLTLWTAVAPGMSVFRTNFEQTFNALSIFVFTWITAIQQAFNGLPAFFSDISSQIVTALGQPFSTFATNTWNPFATGLNKALDQIPATAGIDIPLLFPTAHEGGVIGGALPVTGGNLKSGEVLVKMESGEGVIPADVMRNMTARQFESIRSGNLVGGGAATTSASTVGIKVGVAPPSGLTPLAGFLPDTITSELKQTMDGVRGSVAGLLASAFYLPRFMGGLVGKAIDESIKFVQKKVDDTNIAEARAQLIASGATGPEINDPAFLREFATGGGRGGLAVSAARTQLGVPYVWGGTTPNVGLDCSGLTQWAWRQAGVNIPRVSQDQQNFRPIPGGNLLPGDLVFYGRPAGHVAMNIGSGMIIQAPRTGDVVKISGMGSPTSFTRPALANGAIITAPMSALLGEAGPEVVLPLTRPMRALQLAQQSGLMQVLADAQNTANVNVAASQPATGATPAGAGGLFPGSGNTYNIYGVGMEQVIAEIRAREEAAARSRFTRR